MAKYLALIAGLTREVIGLVTSAGAADANKLVETGSNGRLDASVLPTGIGADTEQMPASEALAAGDLLAAIVAAGPPFSVVFTVWLSITAALGLSFRPAWARTLLRRQSCICRHWPSLPHWEK